MDFAPAPRERDRDADYFVAFQSSASFRAAPFLRSVVLERRMLRKAEPSDGINTDPRLVNRIFGRLAQ